SGNIALNWVPSLFPIVFFLLITWMYLRLLLVAPASAIQGQLNFLTAFKATGGNVFRLLGSSVLLVILCLLALLAASLVMFVLFYSLQMTMTGTGTDTSVGQVIGFFSIVLFVVFFGFLAIAMQVIAIAWFAKSWAALRQQD
ncbi:MAG: hypothetical protein AAF723_05080, partial [Pseudomonadota bacterium]